MNGFPEQETNLNALIRDRKFDQALQLCDQLLCEVGDEKTHRAQLLNRKGEIYWYRGDILQAISVFEKAVEETKHIPSTGYAEILNNLGISYKEVGLYQKADMLLQQSLQIRKQNNGEPLDQMIHTLNNLGIVKRILGQYTQAEALYLEAIQKQKERFGVDKPEYTNLLNNLGLLYFTLGMNEKASQLYEECRDLRLQLMGKESMPYIQILNNLAAVHHHTRLYEQAQSEYLEVIAFLEKKNMLSHPAYEKALKNYASLLLTTGQYDSAMALIERALAGIVSKYGTENLTYAKFLSERSYAYFLTARLPQSLSGYKEAFRILIRTVGIRNQETIHLLSRLAEALLKSGEIESAFRVYLKVVTLQNDLLLDIVYTFHEEEMLHFLKAIKTDSDRLLTLLYEHFRKDTPKLNAVYRCVLLRKGILLEVDRMRSLFLTQENANTEDSMAKWKECKALLAKALYYGQPLPKENGNEISVKSLLQRIKAIEQQWMNTVPKIAQIDRLKNFGVGELYEKLTDSTTLLDVFFVESGNRYLVFKLEHSTITLHSVENAQNLHSILRDYRSLIGGGQQNRGSQSIQSTMQQIRERETLARRLFDEFFLSIPLQRERTYVISSDHDIARLSFETLLTPEGEYVLEFCDIRYLTTAKELLFTPPPKSDAHEATIIVDPDFDHDSKEPVEPRTQMRGLIIDDLKRTQRSGTGFLRLEGTEAEGRKTQYLLQKAGWFVKEYISGKQAVKKRILDTQFPRLLHIATHGFFLEETQEAYNPLLRSGLAFSGVNVLQEDGILTAYEVSGMNLHDTQTVILSACDTGLGESSIGEGILGFQRAFFIGGVREMVMTLWNISDNRSADLMEEFYHEYIKTGNVPNALRKAKLALLERDFRQRGYVDAYTWGGFICIQSV